MPLPDLAQLQAAAARNAQVNQQLSGVNEQYERAQALRGGSAPQINQYGTVSPLSVLANVVGQSQGRRQMRELRPRREALMAEQAGLQGQQQGANLALTLGKAQREQELFDRKMASGGGDTATYTDGDRKVNVLHVNGKPMIQDEQGAWTLPLPPEFTPTGGGHGRSGKGGGRASKYVTKGVSKFHQDASTKVREFGSAVADFKPWYTQATGMPTGFINKIANTASTADIMTYASQSTDARVKEAAQWWARFRMTYELATRHKIFGATLTPAEAKSWDSAVGVINGMDGAQAQARLKQINDDMVKAYASDLNSQMSLSSANPQETAFLEDMASNAGFSRGEDGKYGLPEAGGPEDLLQGLSPSQQQEFNAASPEEQAEMMQYLEQLSAPAPVAAPTQALPTSARQRRQARGPGG